MTLLANKKILGLGVVVTVSIALLAALSWANYASAQPSSVTIQTIATATTSLIYMTPGTATTTYQFDNSLFSAGKVANMTAIDSGSMLVTVVASSSVGGLSTIRWQFQCSNNNIDWYGQNLATVGSNTSVPSILESTTTVSHLWTPGTVATTTKWVDIPICAGAHERVVFSIPGEPNLTASSSAFYLEVGLKKNPSNP